MHGASVLQGCAWCISVAGMCVVHQCCRDVHGALVLQRCVWCISVARMYMVHLRPMSISSLQNLNNKKFHFQNWQVLTIMSCLVICFYKNKTNMWWLVICMFSAVFISRCVCVWEREREVVCVCVCSVLRSSKKSGERKNNNSKTKTKTLSIHSTCTQT